MLEASREIIKNKAVVADDWQVLRLDEGQSADAVDVPPGKIILPLAVWQSQRANLAARAAQGEIGIWLASDARPEELKDDLARFQLIAVDFPRFVDGRGYSVAYNLRTRLGYTGQLRAIGDVLRDQLFFMQRLGFDAFAPRADKNIHDAVAGLFDFSETYQHAVDQKSPLFRRVQRAEATERNLQFGDGLGI